MLGLLLWHLKLQNTSTSEYFILVVEVLIVKLSATEDSDTYKIILLCRSIQLFGHHEHISIISDFIDDQTNWGGVGVEYPIHI